MKEMYTSAVYIGLISLALFIVGGTNQYNWMITYGLVGIGVSLILGVPSFIIYKRRNNKTSK